MFVNPEKRGVRIFPGGSRNFMVAVSIVLEMHVVYESGLLRLLGCECVVSIYCDLEGVCGF